MPRILLYPSIALVAATTAGLSNTGQTGSWQPLNPELFARPFNAAIQQFDANFLQGRVPTAPTPQGFYPQPPDVFAKPLPPTQQQFLAQGPEHVPQSLDVEGVFYQPPDLFKQPFPVVDQQFHAIGLQGNIPSPVTPKGWYGLQLDYRFAKPFPVASQQYNETRRAGFIATVQPDGWRHHEFDYAFAKPFSASGQQFTGMFKFPPVAAPQGWWGIEYDYAFKRPVAVTEQPYTTAPEPEQFLPGFGWYGYQFDYKFAKPFPVTEQIFSVWDLVGEVPPFNPPGAGKRYKKPTDYLPQPAYDAKPNKPFRPVWDKPRQGEVEQPAPSTPLPPPLPPASIFGAPRQATPPTALNLPDFSQFAAPDPLALTQRLRDAQDMSDAIAILKQMGLIQEG